jgi:hypothetical protein
LSTRDDLTRIGERMRRTSSLGISPASLDDELRAMPEPAEQSWNEGETLFERGAAEAFEAAFAESDEEKNLFSASAQQALKWREELECYLAALSRWEQLHNRPSTQSQKLTAHAAQLDRMVRAKIRSFVPLNAWRRTELSRLDDSLRASAWWFSARVQCDGLLAALADSKRVDAQHLASCDDCQRDLKRSAGVEEPRARHLTPDQLWDYDLGLLSKKERAEIEAHCSSCAECEQAMTALKRGDDAISDALSPSAALTPSQRSVRARHRVVEENENYRVILAREHNRVRVVIRPLSSRGIAMVALALLPETKPRKPKSTAEGLEFDLGDDESLWGKTARVMLKLQPNDPTIELDIEL